MRTLMIAALAACATGAFAVTNWMGDDDSFGLRPEGTPCPDGTLWRDDLGGSFFSNYQEGTDPFFTDKWDGGTEIRYSHLFTASDFALGATLHLRVAGLADDRGPYDVYGDGVLLGQISTNTVANNFQMVRNLSFGVGAGLLADGQLDIYLDLRNNSNGDGYSIDYSKLEAVPEPGTLAALGLGLAALRRRRR